MTRTARLALALALLAIMAALLWSRRDALAPGADRPEIPEAARGGESRPWTDPAPPVALERAADGFRRPLFVTHAGDERLFVVEQEGRVRVVTGAGVDPVPFLDITPDLDNSRGERGLLGVAFAPDFAESGAVYVSHTAPGPAVVIARYLVPAGATRPDPASRTLVLEMDDPASNHNGGMVSFGPDGMLWAGTGDGGRGGDPWNNARNLDSLLGKLLRLDVSALPYRVPSDNPYAAGGGRGEIWASGLRNPWRFSFDRTTGELWTADVGQGRWEEVNVEDPRRGGGLDYGWRTMEGRHCFDPPRGCDPQGLHLPVHEYGHDQGCSVTGGYVYRGQAIPGLVGTYLFADYCRGTVWGLVRDGAGRARVTTILETGFPVSSFGENAAGELYLCDHSGGAVFRLVPAPH